MPKHRIYDNTDLCIVMDDILISQPCLRCYLQFNLCQQRCIFVFSVVIQTYLQLETSLLAPSLSQSPLHSYGILKIVLTFIYNLSHLYSASVTMYCLVFI